MFNHDYIGHWLGITSNALRRKSEYLLGGFDLTFKQFGVLNTLYKEDRLTSRELVARLSSDSSTIMAIVDQLEKKGYIKREPSRKDRRIKHLLLQKKAMDIKAALVSRVDGVDTAIREALSEEEIEGLKSTLQKILIYAINPLLESSDKDQTKENA